MIIFTKKNTWLGLQDVILKLIKKIKQVPIIKNLILYQALRHYIIKSR